MSNPTLSVEQIDPKTLLVDVNIRTATALDKDFLASIRELGVLMPVVAVRTADGAIRVRYGHRRTLAAIETERATIPVVIVGDEDADDVARIVAQWHENEQRDGLSTADKIAAVEQLSLMGLNAAQIAKRTKTPKVEVESAFAANASALAKGAAERYEFLTLDMAAAVAEFETDSAAVKVLVSAAKKSDGDFAHALQRARDERDRAAQHAALVEELTAQGVQIIDRPSYDDKGISRVVHLRDADGKPLTVEQHTNCPGHAAFITANWNGVEAVPVCTNWKANGHRDSMSSSPRPAGPMDEKAKAERKRVIQNNKEWKSAETVRREWLATFLTRKTPPKGTAVYVAGELGHGPKALTDALSKADTLAATLLGTDANHSRKSVAALATAATDARAQVIALGVVLAAVEAATGVHSWRNPSQENARYFAFLVEQGYVLSDVEKIAAGQTSKPRASKRAGAATESTDQAAA